MLFSCHHCLAWKKAPYSICCWWGTYFDFFGVENLAKYKRRCCGVVLCCVVVPIVIISNLTKTKPEGRLTRSKAACVCDLHSFEDGLALLRLVFQHHTCEDLYWSENYCPHYKHLHDRIITINASSSKSTSLACIRPILLEVIRVLNLRIILLIINIGGGLIDPKLPKTKKS